LSKFYSVEYNMAEPKKMENLFLGCAKSPVVRCVYFAIILILLLVIVYHLHKKPSESLVGVGLGHGGGYSGQTSGATQRHATEFSATNQLPRETVLTADIAEIDPSLSRVGRPIDVYRNTEKLLGSRGEPVFWEIGSRLGDYQTSQVAPMLAEATATERMLGTNMGKISKLEDDVLAKKLYEQ
jgi:hypothetical protein